MLQLVQLVSVIIILFTAVEKRNTVRCSYRIIKCRNFSRYNPVNLRNDVRDIDWTPVSENNSDVNSALSYFTSKLKDVFDTHAPLIEKRIKGKPCGWMNENIMQE